MEKILEKLFALDKENIFDGSKRVDKEYTDREWDLYFLIMERLSKSDAALFSEYLSLRQERENAETINAYEYGFKTAVRLFAESLQE